MRVKLTIQDIARLAGVSKATVSRVLNNKPTVDPEIRERVMKVVNERGFVPSITATVMRGGRAQLIGVLAPPLTWPSVPEIMRGVAAVVERTSYEIVLYTIGSTRDHSEILDRILAMKLTSGFLAICPGPLAGHLVRLHEQGLSIVTIDDQELPIQTPWVGTDNYVGGYEITRHLIQLGHRRIAYIQGPREFRCVRERYEGYCRALTEAGIVVDPELVIAGGEFTIEGGEACARTIFSRSVSERPDAIFAGNDQMAYGVLRVVEEFGIRVPADIAVVGFDDIPLAEHMKPPLTTIRQPLFEMGETAAELLLSIIDARLPSTAGSRSDNHVAPFTAKAPREVPIRKLLPNQLIIRSSCGTVPALANRRPPIIPSSIPVS
jgi:LacI family transcriptional regulator